MLYLSCFHSSWYIQENWLFLIYPYSHYHIQSLLHTGFFRTSIFTTYFDTFPIYIYIHMSHSEKMDSASWETVTRKNKKRSLSPNAVTQNDRRSWSRSPRSSDHRRQSCSPPPDRMPSPKGQSKKPRRQSHDPTIVILWTDKQEFSSQPEKRKWQECLVQSTEIPHRADIAFIRKGVHTSANGPEPHITVDYKLKNSDEPYEHVTTWHIDLTEAEYEAFKKIERIDPGTMVVDPLPSPALDDATLESPPSP